LNHDRYAGLPADLAPPLKTAEAIAALDRLAEREALFARIPPDPPGRPGWQAWIRTYAVLAIAKRIVDTPGLERRREMMPEVPEGWRAEVTQHVLRLWRWRALWDAAIQRAVEELVA
jgi:hypothetical protein